MQTAVYIIYELLIRLQELKPDVGDYLSNKTTTDGIVVFTSTGKIVIPDTIILRQINTPASITTYELIILLDSFIANNK
jgi:hypothetical protein